MDTNNLVEELETIDSKIKYYEKLLSFYKTNETNTEDIIEYTNLIDSRNKLKTKLTPEKRFVNIYSNNLIISYLEYFCDITIDYFYSDFKLDTL